MMKLILIFLLPFTLYASKILSYNIYDRTDRVDVMITFDTPYNGVIKQSMSKSKIIVKLEDAFIESSKTKQLSSNFLQSLNITPMSGYTQIVASIPPSVKLQASKTADSYGLRLRFTNIPSKNIQDTSVESTSFADTLPTKRGDEMSQSYYIVVAILVIGILILFIIKKKMTNKKELPHPNSWLFHSSNEKTTPAEAQTYANGDISIRFQKSIDSKNSVVMLDFGEQSYLVLMGANNILLDKFNDNKPTTQEDFETILRSRHQELDDFLRVEKNEMKEPLQSYKEKAASILYEV